MIKSRRGCFSASSAGASGAQARRGLTIVSSGFDTKSIAPPIPLTNLFGIMKLACKRTKRAIIIKSVYNADYDVSLVHGLVAG